MYRYPSEPMADALAREILEDADTMNTFCGGCDLIEECWEEGMEYIFRDGVCPRRKAWKDIVCHLEDIQEIVNAGVQCHGSD